DTVSRLVASADPVARPVMGALAFALRRTGPGETGTYSQVYDIIPTLHQYVELGDEVGCLPITDYPRDQVTRVAGTGAACLLIHRTVLHRIRRKHGDVWFDPVVHSTGDRGKPRRFSEDLSFCVRVAEI